MLITAVVVIAALLCCGLCVYGIATARGRAHGSEGGPGRRAAGADQHRTH
jgi:hypothetical protein